MIVVGVVCLYLSDAVVTGWWQNTLDAFGVGFIVGGIVDVLAISGLNAMVTGEQKRRENDREAVLILESSAPLQGKVAAARSLLAMSDGQMNPDLKAELEVLVVRAEAEKIWE